MHGISAVKAQVVFMVLLVLLFTEMATCIEVRTNIRWLSLTCCRGTRADGAHGEQSASRVLWCMRVTTNVDHLVLEMVRKAIVGSMG